MGKNNKKVAVALYRSINEWSRTELCGVFENYDEANKWLDSGNYETMHKIMSSMTVEHVYKDGPEWESKTAKRSFRFLLMYVPDSFPLFINNTISYGHYCKRGDFRFVYDDYGWNATLCEYLGNGGDVVIPSKIKVNGKSLTVDTIGDYAFAKENQTNDIYNSLRDDIKSIKLPDTIKNIGFAAFYGCDGLREITLPESVKYIANEPFTLCTKLEVCFCKNKDAVWSKYHSVETPCIIVYPDEEKEYFESLEEA